MMSTINLKHLAQRLNMSASTVSRALQGSKGASLQTQERVQALATELNYEPDLYASNLRRKHSKTIGVVVPEVNTAFFPLVLSGIEEVAWRSGYHVLIYLSHDDPRREATIARHLSGRRVDGLLMSVAGGGADATHLRQLQSQKPALVFFDRVCEELSAAAVTTNDYESGYQATRHLIEAGCWCIAPLLASDHLSSGRQRLRGYQAALRDHSLVFDERLVFNTAPGEQNSTAHLTDFLRHHPEVDGLFAAAESLALSSYHACRELGRRIPNDVKIIGFSNLNAAGLLDPPLTTITQPAYEMGREATKALLRAIERPHTSHAIQRVVLLSELTPRRSTARL